MLFKFKPEEKLMPTAASRTVYVGVPRKVSDDLKHMQRVTEVVLGKLGCAPCHSGFDLRFVPDPYIFNEKGELASGPQG
jgi:hypothetical protein